MSVRVKICGITTLPDARAAVEAGADALGFMFYAGSKRAVGHAAAAEIIGHLPTGVTRVGVFVDPTVEEVRQAVDCCGLDVVQLHGEESPEFCARIGRSMKPDVLRAGVARRGQGLDRNVAVIKAFRMRDRESLAGLAAYRACAAWLLDSFVAGEAGGTGTGFSWELALAAQAAGHPIILAGGLTPENVLEAVRQVGPYGVDVSSGVESAPGRKEPGKMRAFVSAAKRALP
jgi:phosphoribosylanthranilate isomerase